MYVVSSYQCLLNDRESCLCMYPLIVICFKFSIKNHTLKHPLLTIVFISDVIAAGDDTQTKRNECIQKYIQLHFNLCFIFNFCFKIWLLFGGSPL